MSTVSPPARRARTYAVYAGLLVLAVVAYLVVREQGRSIRPSLPPAGARSETHAHGVTFARLLLTLAAVTLAARVVGGAFRRWLGQPPVIGEILTGLMLGPSLLGALWPEAQAFVLPAEVAPHLSTIANLGVVLFMLLVGMEIELAEMRRSSLVTLAISHASIVVPFLLGSVLALWMYADFATQDVSFTAFSLFIGISVSVTAFPVLARILTDRKVQTTPLGTTALACAAVGDATAWVLLALVTGIIQSQVSGAALTLVWTVAYLAFMFLCARPMLRWVLARVHVDGEPASRTALAVVFGGLLLSALATDRIGIHPLFGAFVMGVILPREGDLRHQVQARLEDVVLVLLLPSFFAFTGLRTQVGLIQGWHAWGVCLLVLAVACAGKFGGSLVAARSVGIGWRHSAALGILMNTRGLMELIVLNIGLEIGVITPTLFTMLVIMAIVTTFATTPLLDLVLGKAGFEGALVPAEDATDAEGSAKVVHAARDAR